MDSRASILERKSWFFVFFFNFTVFEVVFCYNKMQCRLTVCLKVVCFALGLVVNTICPAGHLQLYEDGVLIGTHDEADYGVGTFTIATVMMSLHCYVNVIRMKAINFYIISQFYI